MSFHALHGSEGYAARSDEVVAHSRKRLRGSAHSVGNVPDAWIFSFQSALSCVALRKPNLHIPRGEIVLSLFNGHFFEVLYPSGKYNFDLASDVAKVLDAWIFSFQGSLSRKALRKLNLRIPCGEICPLTFQWTFFCPLSGITQNIFLLFCGSVRLRHARFAWSCRAPQHMRTGFSPR